jgi:hypothetical protein
VRLAALTLLLPLALVAAARGTEAPPAVTLAVAGDVLRVTNNDGTWTVRTRCHAERGWFVGPGYVSRLVLPDGRVLVDDWRHRGSLNDPVFGGLGAFGWHHSRGRPGKLRFTGRNAWEIDGRTCAAANHGFGVTASRLIEQPLASGDAVTFAIAVDFSDMYTYPAPLLRVEYRYRFEPDVVKSWIEIVPLCPRGRCGRTRRLAFVKEPKLVAHVTGGRFTRMATFDEDGSLACQYVGGGPARGPILRTGQCGAPERARLQLDFGSARSGADGHCAERACLSVVMQSGPTTAWDGGDGLDAWALSAARLPAALRRDTGSVDGLVWGCHTHSPADPRVRRWETAARRGPDGAYTALGGIFPAWEGGRGGYDCEPLARTFPRPGARFRAFAEYSLVDG